MSPCELPCTDQLNCPGRVADTNAVFAWHATTVEKLPVILSEGLRPGSGIDQFDTFDHTWHWPVALAHLYPIRPVYLSLHEPVSWMPEWHAGRGSEAALVRVDREGLALLPDIPTLSDYDCSFLPEGIQLPSDFEEHELLWELGEFATRDRIIAWQKFERAASMIIAITASCGVCEAIDPGRIEVVDWKRMWPHHWYHLPD